MSKKSDQSQATTQSEKIDQTKSPYCHELADTIEGWDALIRRIEDLKKRADNIQLSYLMTTEDVAAFLSIDKGWLNDRRTAGKPPFYYKFGHGNQAPIRYSLLEVMDFLTMCCRRHSTSDGFIIDIDLAEVEYFNKYGRKIGEQSSKKPLICKQSTATLPSQQTILQ